MASSLAVHHQFKEFGASLLPAELRGVQAELTISADEAESRRAIRVHCPVKSGVYGWISAAGHLIYIGKSKSLRHRLVSYFAKQPADPKMGRIRRQSIRIVWEPVAHELLALLREQELIHRFRPEFNSQGQPHRRQPGFIAISRSPAPHVFVAKHFSADCQRAFGPIAGTNDLRQAAVVLNHWFRLRDCSDNTPFDFGRQLRLFDDHHRRPLCLRHELGSCLGPCAGLCSQVDYQICLTQATNFLTGTDRSCLHILESHMRRAAEKQEFERAAWLRDRWQALTRLDRQLQQLRIAQQTIHGIMPVNGAGERRVWLLFHRGRLADHLPEPRTIKQLAAACERIRALSALPPQLPRSILETNLQWIVGSWFRQHADQLSQLTPFQVVLAANAGFTHSMRDHVRRPAG